MTQEKLPKWCVETFVHTDGKTYYKDAEGRVRHKNSKFAKGFGGGNPTGISSDHAKAIQKIRSMALGALHDKGLPRVIQYLDKEDLGARDLVSLVKLLIDISVPKQIEAPEENTSNIPQILITKDAFDRAQELDKEYEQDSEKAEED